MKSAKENIVGETLTKIFTTMATDFRICGALEMGFLCRRQIFTVFQVILFINHGLAMSVWMPQFLSGGHGRNIRHLPCVSRKTGEQGTCMFAYTCMKSNGTHLGTCIDRFYFGSCCKLNGHQNDLLTENHINYQPINNNQVSSSQAPKLPTTPPTNALFNTKYTVSNGEKNHSAFTNKPQNMVPISQIGSSHGGLSTVKTDVDSAQNLATETYFLTPTTEKIYIPIHTSLKPNKTENLSSSSGLFTTVHGSSSSIFSDLKRPTTQSEGLLGSSTPTPLPSSTTQSYYLSTFQVVHNENSGTVDKTPSTVFTKVTTLSPSTPGEASTTWTPIKHITTPTSTTQFKKTTTPGTPSRPVFTPVTTKKPVKPVKPITTTRKPPTKKPTSKPVVKPSASTTKPSSPVKKPVQTTFTHLITTTKPSSPIKKPVQPTKKPTLSSPKPLTSKPIATSKPPVLSTKVNATTVSSGGGGGGRPGASTSTARTTTTSKTTFTTRSPTQGTFRPTEVVFTKPGTKPPTISPSSQFGITTFRPDLTPTSKKPDLVTGSHLTTFNYASEGVKVPTTESSQSTISNEISSSETIFESIPEIQEENTNVIFQQIGTTTRPRPTVQTDLMKQNDTNVPFFPEATKPSSTKQPWIEIVQSTTSESTAVPTTAKPTTTTTKPVQNVQPLLPGVNISDYTQVCGRRLFPQSRVVGGEKSTFGKWPWQISLRQWRTSTYLHKCGAALLNENWAITAAHCVENVPPSDLLLRLGEHDLSTEDEPYGFQERRVQIVASHPQFDPRTFEYDLALLRFYEPVKFQPNIIPVCVPEDSTNFVGQTAYVTGWGRLYEDGPLPSVLQEVSVPVINNTLCENMYRSAGYIEHIPEIFICAGWKKGGFDSCEGDSGGPMVIQRPDKRWLLAGVISWGIGCAEPNQPGVYTRISEFREWIHQILQF